LGQIIAFNLLDFETWHWEEWTADTNPTKASSVLRIEGISKGPPVTVQFASSSNRFYSLLYTTNLNQPAWTDVLGQTNLPGNGTFQVISDTNAIAPRFYRLSVWR
jgi:hypothetical protein